MRPDKAKLGNRHTCHECGTKFYDLNAPEPACPECGTDPATAPVQDIRSLLSSKGRKRKPKDETADETFQDTSDDDLDDDDDDDASELSGVLDDFDTEDDEEEDD